MSKKALITFLFVVIAMIIICNNFIIQANCYELENVNTTKEEMKDTKELNELAIKNSFEKVLVKEEYVHGIKVCTYNNITYITYGDGDKEIINSVESIEQDASCYNGTTFSLLPEVQYNMDEYKVEMESVLGITNKYRQEAGCNDLVLDKNLCIAATIRALEMSYIERLSHIRPDGAKCFRVLDDLNIYYIYAGENIGEGFSNTEDVCKAWKNSSSHYENIVSGKYNKMGVGIARSINGKYYWVQIFSN